MTAALREIEMSPATEEGKWQIEFSVIIPVYNEEQNLEPLYNALAPVLDEMNRTCEVIFIDDGSTDGTLEILRKLNASDPTCRVIRFRRNFGQTAAMAAGFAHARGEIIVTLDGDLQNDPNDIPLLLSKIAEGYDVVSGWRVRRKDKFLTRRLPSICVP